MGGFGYRSRVVFEEAGQDNGRTGGKGLVEVHYGSKIFSERSSGAEQVNRVNNSVCRDDPSLIRPDPHILFRRLSVRHHQPKNPINVCGPRPTNIIQLSSTGWD